MTPVRPTLFAGDRGAAVKALQLCLRRALGSHAVNNLKGDYGTLTIKDVARWEAGQQKKGHNILVSGRSFGPKGWELMEKHIKALPEAQRLLAKQAILDAAQAAQDTADALRREIVAAAWSAYERRMGIAYSQYRPMPKSLGAARAMDCSTFTTLAYKDAGAPDPNGRGYDGYGFTGTLWVRGTSVSVADANKADMVFYGYHPSIPGAPGHVALYVGNGRVLSLGSYPMRYLPVYYRSDVRGVKSYLA